MTLTQSILFASGFTSALLVAATYQIPATSQAAQPQSVLLAQATTDQLPQLPPSELANTFVPTEASLGRTPMMMMSIDEGRVSVNLENATADPLIYQALGDTEPRILAAGSDITLSNLHVPTTVTFSFENMTRNRLTKSGLTKAEVSSVADGTLKLVVQPTDDLDTEASNLTVESGGGVFVF